ncbi:hypothetical protein [Serratia marcescens]|uniref:hypothetical protein n=1 Tax=Serratia marcescens TaxID=615 RepID=UPI0009715170|nr:hypothetical protein [Serratia marcescens]AQT55433.1 hypothetical protein AR325_26800 [Serratia marcescens]UJA53678.1 hypothetical protein L1F17_22395 [Serratia marcescens]
MGSYSSERKAAVIVRMLPPHSQSVYKISRLEGIPVNTLYGWRSLVGNDDTRAIEWSRVAGFAVIVETAPLSAHAVAEYCRRKGLYPEHIQQ